MYGSGSRPTTKRSGDFASRKRSIFGAASTKACHSASSLPAQPGGATARRYCSAASGESLAPTLAIRWWFGTQMQPPDMAVVPPTRSDFSATSTRWPAAAATIAADRPAAPEPSTMTSNEDMVWAPDGGRLRQRQPTLGYSLPTMIKRT